MEISQQQWRTSLRALTYEGGRQKENPQQKRLKELQESLKHLQEMPSPKTTRKQAAAEKVAWLKQRLEALKMMLLHATPEQAKALSRELKSIAKELASAAKSLSSGSGSGTTQPNVHASTEADAGSSGDTVGVEEGAAKAAVRQAEVEVSPAAGDTAGGLEAEIEAMGGQSDDEADEPTREVENDQDDGSMEAAADKNLRQLLAEARKLLKEAINLLKAKLADEEARKNAQSAEKSLGDLDQALVQGEGGGLYSDLGNMGGGIALAGGVEVGTTISVSV